MDELEKYMKISGISIAATSDEINYSYISEWYNKLNLKKANPWGILNFKKEIGRNNVYDYDNNCCLTYMGLVESVKSYEDALGIKIAHKYKHTKRLAGIIPFRDR